VVESQVSAGSTGSSIVGLRSNLDDHLAWTRNDSHGSHDTLNLIELAQQHNIILFCLPPHTTHKLQPLDVGVFGPFSRAWTDHCDEIVLE
jgi:hypothetical protein